MTSPDNDTLKPSREAFVEAMAHVAGPVAIITTGSLEDPKGLTASATCSLSADPPSLIVCVNKTATAHDTIIAQQRFAANFLASHQHELAMLFTQKDLDRFATCAWTTLSTGSPILEAALVAFDCRVQAVFDGFSHSIIVGAVEAILPCGHAQNGGLMWHKRRFCTTAEASAN